MADDSLGFLSDMFSPAAGAPTSLAPPGIPAPTPDSAGMAVNGNQGAPDPNSPTFKGFLGALSAGVNPKALQLPQPPPAPTINMPQPQGGQGHAQALAQIMAQLNAKNNPQQPQQPGQPS